MKLFLVTYLAALTAYTIYANHRAMTLVVSLQKTALVQGAVSKAQLEKMVGVKIPSPKTILGKGIEKQKRKNVQEQSRVYVRR